MTSESNHAEQIVISSADQAWALLRSALDGDELPERIALVFDGWPRFHMKFSGRDWHGTVPTRVMAPLLDVQRDLYRAYANVCYGDSNLRRLRDEDRELLELVVKVNEGSSDYEAPLHEQLTELARKAIEKMDSRSLVITILGIAVVVGGVEIGKAWIAERQEAKKVEQTIELSKQETERLKVFSEAVKQQPVLGETREDFEASQNRLLKSVKPGDEVVTKGVALHGDQVAEITQGERARAEDIDISGTFRVLANDASKGAGFRIKVSRIEDGMTFSAEVPLELDADAKRLIQKAEWSKGAVLVRLDISASSLRGGVMNAVVTGASAVPEGRDR
ncbi:hypothetical protein [Thauera sp. 2A1]|uniref:hypothetical protein n=1 Tax=Thauera sp. 2A1 TaxID=2570191 RepID=UPI001290E61B|nr:hypothetical protein [Thauera sp. 2A1]KAI5914591.1 hypothetical protein GH664_11640 [Thauera sp. 2A1]